MEGQFDRFKGFDWFENSRDTHVTIGGAGGIGSWMAFFLSRADFSVTLFDDDIIEAHNLSGQLFRHEQVGLSKVKAVQENLIDFCGRSAGLYRAKVTQDSYMTAFFFSAFDNMVARADAFSNWYESNNNNSDALFIDGRLAGEHLQIFCIKRGDSESIALYKREHLFEDSEVEDLGCTTKQTTHSAAMIASHMMGFFTNHISNIKNKEDIREVPFYYEYLIPANLTIEE